MKYTLTRYEKSAFREGKNSDVPLKGNILIKNPTRKGDFFVRIHLPADVDGGVDCISVAFSNNGEKVKFLDNLKSNLLSEG